MSKSSTGIEAKAEMPRHLEELAHLVGHPVHVEDLVADGETELIRMRAMGITRNPSWRHAMEFHEKSRDRFGRFIKAIQAANPTGVYIWTPRSNLCGLLRPIAMDEVNWGFEFTVNPDGILVVLTSDLRDRMVLDFSENDSGDKELEIEVSGENWGNTQY